MDKIIFLGILFIVINLLGFYLAYLYGRKTKQFRRRGYIAIIILPIMSVIALAYFIDFKILYLFIASLFVGFGLEYLLGLTYHKTLNEKLWEYKRLSVNGYSSLLSIPIWGIAGVIFWFISKLVGL
jgi:uncharacterized membrane protein